MPAEGSKAQSRKKNNPEFIGYTYKPMEEPTSALVKALVDLDSYRTPHLNPINHIDYLQPEHSHNVNTDYQINIASFKKGQDKAERISKEFFAASALSTAANRAKNEEREREKER